MRTILATAAVLSLLAGTATARTQSRERTDAPPIGAYKIILVGDSTMAPGSGWASMFCAEHVKSSIACLNLGRGGRSTRSYRAEGSWDLAIAETKVPGYRKTWVLIQFGHNDQSDKPERWTDMITEFPANLKRMVEEVRAAGAEPVLLTPLSRRAFRAGKLDNTLEPWAAEVRKVAAAMQVPLVDLNAHSAALIQKLGPVEATKLAMAEPLPEELASARAGTTLKPRTAEEARVPDPAPTPNGPRGSYGRKFDYTHVGDAGARVFSAMVANDLAAAVPELRIQLVP